MNQIPVDRQNLQFYESMHFDHTMRLYHLYLGDEK